jgi:hypothetical protein
MRRFLAFAVLLVCSLPVGVSITGCQTNPNNVCYTANGHAYGISTSQIVNVLLQPETTGLSLAWGQTGSLGTAQAFNCNNATETVTKWTYGSKNLLLADISPSGEVCAGTWNRNSPGGAPNFTICTPPSGSSLSSFSGCTPTTCGTVQVTVQGGGVTSNPVNVYVHPPITSMTIPNQNACVSQGATLSESLLAETTAVGPGGVTLCSPTTVSCVNPAANIGTVTFAPVTPNVVTINNTTPPPTAPGTTLAPNPNGVATANLPGSTVINASNAEVTSAAGYFSTCPPTRISLAINGATSATVTPSSPQTIVATTTDVHNTSINGLTLNYGSTEPQNLSVSSAGVVTGPFPSHASVTATCEPPTCNPSPVNLVGVLGNGMPVAGNIVTVNSPGRSSNQIWMASSKSPYFSEVDLETGGAAAPVRLPYTPNSMVMNQTGTTLFFGSYHELMVYSTAGNTLSQEVPAVPGVVLAASPTGTTVVVDDQLRQLIYLYGTTAGTATSISGIASRAQYSPDGTTVYITGVDPATGQNTLFVYNTSTGWSRYALKYQPTYSCQLDASPTDGNPAVPAYNPLWDPFCGPDLTVTVPSVATFLSGNSTVAHSYCPNGSASPPYYPQAAEVGAATDQLTATADGNHILGASLTSFSDIWLYQGSSPSPPTGVPVNACPAYDGTPLSLTTSFTTDTPLPITPTEIDQVVASPDSSLAFITYNATSAAGLLPYYVPASASSSPGAAGTLSAVQLSSGAQAPLAGVFSPDGTIFFVSTSGDNLVHEVTTTSTTPTDSTQTIDPKLTNGSGTSVPAQFLAVKSRTTT